MSNSNNIFVKFRNMPVDGMAKTIIVATTLCFICSMVVSFAAVNLKSFQLANKVRDKQKNILQVAGLYYEGINVEQSFASFEPMVVDINEGLYSDKFNPQDFDDLSAANDPNDFEDLKKLEGKWVGTLERTNGTSDSFILDYSITSTGSAFLEESNTGGVDMLTIFNFQNAELLLTPYIGLQNNPISKLSGSKKGVLSF